MKKAGIYILAVVFTTMAFANPTNVFKKKLKVDTEKSTVIWKGYKPTGSHTGTINLTSGSLVLKGDNLVGGSFQVDMSTIKDKENNSRLENHLKSKDFFEIDTYTSSKFEIVSSENKEGRTFITGNMTIKDVTEEVTFSAIVSETNDAVVVTTETFQINRAKFNITFKSKTFFNDLKDNFINDEFDLQVTLIAPK